MNVKLQMHLPELLQESPKLRSVLLKQARRVHFVSGGNNEDMGQSDSGSELLTPAVA